jgi:DNA-binding response OmpR family regulator
MTGNPARWGETSSVFTPEDQVDVLIVDDDDDLRSTWAEIFRSSGYSVAKAEDGDVALRLLSEMTIGVVLLDLRMPRRDGFSVLESLTAPQLVVLASAQALDEATLARVEGKIVTYLEKPIPPERLLHTVAAALGRSQRERSFPMQ